MATIDELNDFARNVAKAAKIRDMGHEAGNPAVVVSSDAENLRISVNPSLSIQLGQQHGHDLVQRASSLITQALKAAGFSGLKITPQDTESGAITLNLPYTGPDFDQKAKDALTLMAGLSRFNSIVGSWHTDWHNTTRLENYSTATGVGVSTEPAETNKDGLAEILVTVNDSRFNGTFHENADSRRTQRLSPGTIPGSMMPQLARLMEKLSDAGVNLQSVSISAAETNPARNVDTTSRQLELRIALPKSALVSLAVGQTISRPPRALEVPTR